MFFLFRRAYLGLTLGLRTASFFLCVLGLLILQRHVTRQKSRRALCNGSTVTELQALRKEDLSSPDESPQTLDYNPERETRL